ncbi:DNA polymerase epsilon subunit 2-like [Tubulanus polymorphus]|uniref:DNA polymerase epsilon subunit 2-like n=1 Tax=Tubulanus polymorphus TaxID=672921 RepID=UPI003DA693B5
MSSFRSKVSSCFKMHGFTLRSDATKYIVEVLTPFNEVQQVENLDRIIEAIQKQQLSSTMIDKSICEIAIEECNAEQDEESDKIFSVIDAFEIPRFLYNPDRKKFIKEKMLGVQVPGLYGDAKAKTSLFKERYAVLLQRTSRHDLFTPPIPGTHASEQSKKFKLQPIEYLLGSSAKLGEIISLGMLTQMKEGKWFLEDPTGAVQLDLKQANFHSGLFTENCFVLAEGWYEDEIFHVTAFGFPPPEPAKTTRAYFGNINFFGGQSATSVKASVKLQNIEKENEDAMIVFLSDVWLDDLKVLEKLRVLFTGYSEVPPVCFVFTGNFTSKPAGSSNHAKLLKDCFKTFTKLILEFPSIIESSKFVFVPGPQDPGPSLIAPRPPIPCCITQEMTDKFPNVFFASNPCRIQYCTQEIVVYREDIVTKMCRNCVKFPKDADIPMHFAKTIICQGHLSPLPLHVAPIYWSFDNAMRVYPLPDLIVCADKFDPFKVTQSDCSVINPGSFARSDYSFQVYIPASRQVEESRISD